MILTPSIKGVFFDLYGTLLLYNNIKKANEEWVSAFHSKINERKQITAEELSPLCREILSDTIEKDKSLDLTTYETKIKVGLDKRRINFSIEEIKELANYSLDVWQNYITLSGDAHYVLSFLKDKYKTALVTNFDHSKHVRGVLNKHKLFDFFEHVIISDEVEINKPDRRIFEIALGKCGLKAEETIFVGDNLNDDIKGAFNAGLLPVLISQEEYNINHAFEIGGEDLFLMENKERIKRIKSLSELITC